MPTATYTHPLFGLVKFKTRGNDWVRGDDIEFLSGFDLADVSPVDIPQLRNVPGAHAGRIQFHKRAHAQVQMVFSDLEKLGLMRFVKTCSGSLNVRLKKPLSKVPPHRIISKEPSNHAFGIAIDLNSDDGSNGDSVAPVAPVFDALGFRWGKSFNDPMHFEVVRFIDRPVSVATVTTVSIDGTSSPIRALNFSGSLVVDVASAQEPLALRTTTGSGRTLKVRGPSGSAALEFGILGDRRYVSMAELSGVARVTMAHDRVAQAVSLTRMRGV